MPYFQLSCDNDNTNTITTGTWLYAQCMGANCTTEEFSSSVNDVVMNVTDEANLYLANFGVSCTGKFSDSASTVGGLFIATVVATALTYLSL